MSQKPPYRVKPHTPGAGRPYFDVRLTPLPDERKCGACQCWSECRWRGCARCEPPVVRDLSKSCELCGALPGEDGMCPQCVRAYTTTNDRPL